jgi:glycosyltransferase involved in cell wall biosynthesis
MKIAVNTRFLLPGYLEGYGYFLYETLWRITRDHPEHEYFFIFDRPFDSRFIFNTSVKGIVTGPAARHPLLWKLWYDIKIPLVLKRLRADVFVSCDGFCSLATKIPQCLVVHDLAFLHYPAFNKGTHQLFYKRYTPRFLEKAKSVATVSEFSKQDIITQYGTDPAKINVVYSAAKEIFYPLSDDDKLMTRDQYTGGKEFFLYTGAIHPRKNLMQLLKAFSVFKKRQQSNFKLVIAGRLAWKYNSFIEGLKTYKYRNDVVMTGYLEEKELVRLTGSAYAMVYPSLWEGFGVPVLEAMHAGVPVITSGNSSMQEIAKEAALYVNPEDHTDIAEKMMRLYKDENLRKELIKKGFSRSAEYSWNKTAGLLWDSILKAVEFRTE